MPIIFIHFHFIEFLFTFKKIFDVNKFAINKQGKGFRGTNRKQVIKIFRAAAKCFHPCFKSTAGVEVIKKGYNLTVGKNLILKFTTGKYPVIKKCFVIFFVG